MNIVINPPVGSRGKAPVGSLGDAPEAEAFLQINAYNFDVRAIWPWLHCENFFLTPIFGGAIGGHGPLGPPLNTPLRSSRDPLDNVFRRKVITTSGIRPPSWNFWTKEASGEVGIYTSEKRAPKNIGMATEIASISVSVVKLLVLPVWGTVSTADLYLMLFSEVERCRYRWKWIGHALKLCRSR